MVEYDVRLVGDGRLPNLIFKEERTFDGTFSTPSSIAEFLKECELDCLAEEHIYMIAVDAKLNPLGMFEISHGAVCHSTISPREIYIRALLCGAVGIILAHNHPSGDTHPSKDDISATEAVKKAGELINIKLHDHIIVGKNYFSFKEENYL